METASLGADGPDPVGHFERSRQTWWSRACLFAGAGALAIVIASLVIVPVAHGLTPVSSITEALESDALKACLIVGLIAGAFTAVFAGASIRRAPTFPARRQLITALALAVQAALLSALTLWFVSGDVSRFATNFLDFDVATPEVGAFVTGAKNTLILAALAELVALTLGLALALFAVSTVAAVRAPARFIVNFLRGTPLLWQLSFLYFGLALGLDLNVSAYTAGVLALGLNSSAYLAEVFRAGIQSIERGQLDAARGLGLSHVQAMRSVILPQAVVRVLPPLLNDFVILIKDTSLVIFLGLTVGERELMGVGQDGYAQTFNATFYVFTALGYLAICLPLIKAVNVVEGRVRSGLVGVAG